MSKLIKKAVFVLAALLAGGGPLHAKDSPALQMARQLNEAFIEVADKVSPSVVVIDIRQKVAAKDAEESGSYWDILPPELRRKFQQKHGGTNQEEQPPQYLEGEGSGVIVSADGYILTNDHVVDAADEILVRLKDGRSFKGEVRGLDPQSDIAVIKIKAAGLTAAKLGNSDASRVGEFVVAIGAPFELNDTVTVGHISAKARTLDHGVVDYLQTDAKILPGNSGGPLVNLYGEVVGINTMIEGLDTGIGFAVPINLAREIKDRLISQGKVTRSYLGIFIEDFKEENPFETGGLSRGSREGVLVKQIFQGGPAARADLREDDVITSVDGKTVQTTRQLQDAVMYKKPGSVTTLEVLRGKKRLVVKVTLSAKPEEPRLADDRGHAPAPLEATQLGMTVRGLTKDLADEFNVDATSGLLITAVERDSLADQQEIKAGDVILKINRKPVTTLRQFRDAIKAADPEHGVVLHLVGDSGTRLVVLKDASAN